MSNENKENLCIRMYALSSCLFSSCDWLFSENYGTKGFLSATLSDNGALPATPEEIQVRYYNNYSNEEYTEKLGESDCFASDGNFLSRIRTGEYRFLAYSTFNNKVRHSSDITQIEIYADTVNSEKYGIPVYANKLRPVHMASESGFIFPEDTTYRTFTLVPMVQKIVINITLKGMSAEHKIETLEAMLSGVITGRKIYTNQPIAEYAGLISQSLQKPTHNMNIPRNPMCLGFLMQFRIHYVLNVSVILSPNIHKLICLQF